MIKRITAGVAMVAGVAMMAGCAGYPYANTVYGLPGTVNALPGVVNALPGLLNTQTGLVPATAQYGTVVNVQYLANGGLAGIAGNVLGNGGQGDLGSLATAAAVSMLANQTTTGVVSGQGVYRVTVRLDNGQTTTYDYSTLPNLRVGDRVRADGNQLYR